MSVNYPLLASLCEHTPLRLRERPPESLFQRIFSTLPVFTPLRLEGTPLACPPSWADACLRGELEEGAPVRAFKFAGALFLFGGRVERWRALCPSGIHICPVSPGDLESTLRYLDDTNAVALASAVAGLMGGAPFLSQDEAVASEDRALAEQWRPPAIHDDVLVFFGFNNYISPSSKLPDYPERCRVELDLVSRTVEVTPFHRRPN